MSLNQESGEGVRKLASTALVVLVPEAETVVPGVRGRHDPTVKLGVPARAGVIVAAIALGFAIGAPASEPAGHQKSHLTTEKVAKHLIFSNLWRSKSDGEDYVLSAQAR